MNELEPSSSQNDEVCYTLSLTVPSWSVLILYFVLLATSICTWTTVLQD